MQGLVCAHAHVVIFLTLSLSLSLVLQVWGKLQRQKRREMDRHYSKHVARKQFRGHFHKTKKKT